MVNIEQNFEYAFAQTGLLKSDFDAQLQALAPHAKHIKHLYDTHALPLLHYPQKTDDLAPLQNAMQTLMQGAEHVVILGTGGSSLGGQALGQFFGALALPMAYVSEHTPKLTFLDNIDQSTFHAFLSQLNLAKTRFIAISKSGGTTETLSQIAFILAALERASLTPKLATLFLGLSEPRKGSSAHGLRDLLEPYGVSFLDHDTGVGGRFSVLTNVGLCAALAMGLDVQKLRDGALKALKPLLDAQPHTTIPFCQGAAFSLLAMAKGKNIQVFLPYTDRLEKFAKWWVQLWAESLGKKGHGSTPICAIGPVDQHSQLQLWLDGPKDKVVTLFTLKHTLVTPEQVVSPHIADIIGQPMLAGKSLYDIVAAQAKATAHTLAHNAIPVRQIALNGITEETLGEVLMHFMLETMISGFALGIDPFDQPAVEQGKIKTREYLSQ